MNKNTASLPAISVLMANYNNGRYIARAIESVINQSHDGWELVIVDDSSTDDSPERIAPYLRDSRIRYYRNCENFGYIGTLKKMVGLAGADIVAILDSDDALHPNAVGEVARVFSENREIGLVYTQNFRCDGNLRVIGTGHSAAIPAGKSNLQCNAIHHFRVFRKSAYQKTSGYDQAMLYAEDIDLTFKLEEVTKSYFVDKPLYYYRILPKSQTHSFKNEMTNRSSTALAKLNAYERRLNTLISNLNKNEIAEVLFFGLFTSLLAGRIVLLRKFVNKLFKIAPLFFYQYEFYSLVWRKLKKIVKLKVRR